MMFKCKICGGSLEVKQGEKIAVCEYCGVRQSIPTFIEPKTQEIYNRANSYLMHNEFDKAENLYNQILFDDNSNADAYWNVLMCHYGVTYVKDPATGKYIPTCNRTLYTPIFNDENYKNAIGYADEKQRELYTSDAKTIDKIQKGIIAVSKHEKPFDIFISYKETDLNGTRTKDSIAAQDLYEKLTAEGYKVFFSRITLEDKIGTEYEPYIYAALASSKVMITVSSSRENIESVWVKNEWSRFLSFAAKNGDKTLIPLYFEMDRAELPDDFVHMPSYDMKTEGFEQELIRGIKKIIPLPVMLLEKRKKRNKILKRAGIAAAACAVIGIICSIPWFMKLPDYNSAMQLYYDKNYPEATWAFADLESYRNSEIMQEKCELSWRKNVASIATQSVRENSAAYYVNPNGTIDTFDYAPGTQHKDYGINEHGKVLSIEMQGSLAALYEDGYVKAFNGYWSNDSKKLNDVIKISPHFDIGIVVLKNDGTMKVINDSEKGNSYADQNWLNDVASWKDIVNFEYYISSGTGMGNITRGAIAGITVDKNLEIAMFNGWNWENQYSYDTSIHTKFKNIKKVDLCVGNETLDIIALTYDNKLLTSIDGMFNCYDASEIVDIELVESEYGDYKIYELHSDGKVYMRGENNYLISDAVHMNNGILVTRSGSIYRLNDQGIEQTEGKTKVLDEWLEEMN